VQCLTVTSAVFAQVITCHVKMEMRIGRHLGNSPLNPCSFAVYALGPSFVEKAFTSVLPESPSLVSSLLQSNEWFPRLEKQKGRVKEHQQLQNWKM